MEQLCAEAIREYQRVFLAPFSEPTPRLIFNFPLLEQPKPQHSYIGLIGMAILSSPEKKMVYEWIMSHYSYFRSRGSGWRNSIRHNLSLNDCFIKAGRAANGKGHYWAIHPACARDFERGDFRRRKAQRKVRRHMGLSVPDGDSTEDSTPPSPAYTPLFNLPSLLSKKPKDFSIEYLLRDQKL